METNFSSATCLQIEQVILMYEWINFNARSVVLNVLILINLIGMAKYAIISIQMSMNDRFSCPNSFDVHFVLKCIFFLYHELLLRFLSNSFMLCGVFSNIGSQWRGNSEICLSEDLPCTYLTSLILDASNLYQNWL